MSETNAPAEAVTPVGLNHLVINVRDIEESHRFYTEVLGLKEVAHHLHEGDYGRMRNLASTGG